MTEEEKQHPMFIQLHEYWAKIKMNNISAVKLFNEIKKLTFWLAFMKTLKSKIGTFTNT